jgi:hypothetical protein
MKSRMVIMNYAVVPVVMFLVLLKYCLQHHALKHPQSLSSLRVTEPFENPHKLTGKIITSFLF